MKKSILFSLMVIGAVAAMITAATSASFTDTVTSNGNTFAAGTLQLSVDTLCAGDTTPDSICARGVAFSATNVAPGDTATTHTYSVHNFGTLPGNLKISQTPSIDVGHAGCALTDWTFSTAPATSSLAAGATNATAYAASVQLKSSAPNACQGATFNLDITFLLDQNP